MGYAKYHEDISERFCEGLAAIGRLEETFAPGTYEPGPPAPTGWVRLAFNDGRPLPDRIALLEGDEPTFNVETDIPDVDFQARFLAGPNNALPAVLISDRIVSFTLDKDGSYLLQLSCGSYYKDYEIDVTRTLDFDHQSPIQQGYLYLQDRPNEWTRERLDTLKRLMIPANRPAGIPDSFCNGILDYHLGLFHAEHENEAIANQRFEEAYKNLRPYIAHSDVAHFICDYILYLMNRFEGCDASRSRGRFGGLRAFFRTPYDEALGSCKVDPPTKTGRFIEVLVESIDQKLLEVAREIRHDSSMILPRALESLENRFATERHDVACRVRLHVVLARGFRRNGNRDQANQHYQSLLQMDTAIPWHPEANKFLNLRS